MANFPSIFAGFAVQANNTIVINSESDFPVQGVDTITLQDGFSYFIGSSVVTTKRFVYSGSVAITSVSPYTKSLTYLGTEAMFSGGTGFLFLFNLGYDCPNGTAFDLVLTGAFLHQNSLLFSCVNLGTISGVSSPSSVIIKNSGVFAISGIGLILDGDFVILSIAEYFTVTTNSSGFIIDWTTATFNNMEITNLEASGPLGSFALVGGSGAVNINAGRVATIRDSTLGSSGAMQALGGGLSENDAAYEFSSTFGVKDSKVVGFIYVTVSAETNVQDGVDVPVAGTFANGSESSQTSSTSGGVITVLNRIQKRGTVSADIDITKSTGSSQSYLIKIRKNPLGLGPTEDVEGVSATTILSGGGSSQISILGPVSFSEGDEFFVTIRGIGTTENITAITTAFNVSE